MVGITLAGDLDKWREADKFGTTEAREAAPARGGLWMRSWQDRDSIPNCCGWLWISLASYPRAPRRVHEIIHARGGYTRGCPRASTAIHARSTAFSTMEENGGGAWSWRRRRDIHMMSTPRLNCPHDYPHPLWALEGQRTSGMGGHLCTQEPSCPQIRACYPRRQRLFASDGARGAGRDEPEKSRVAPHSCLIHSDCG